jgi:ribose-phosphate pyrophosphokinase
VPELERRNGSVAVRSMRRLQLFAGRSFPALAEEIAIQLGVGVVAQSAHGFANGELYVRFEESAASCSSRHQ